MTKQRQQIENDPMTVELRKDLRELRNTVLDYLIDHQPDDIAFQSLDTDNAMISKWTQCFMDELVNESELYSEIAIRIMEPVNLILEEREGTFSQLEAERDKAEEERNEAVEALQRIKRDIEHYGN